MFRYLNTDAELFSRRRFEIVPDTGLIGFADHCINKEDGDNLLALWHVIHNLNEYNITRDAVCAFHYGSFNYNLNTPTSDFDLIVVTMPSMSDLIWDMGKPKCQEHKYPQGIIKEVDFRYFMSELIKGRNPNLMEVYLSKYLWVAEKYPLCADLCNRSFCKNGYLINPKGLFEAYKGIAYSHADKCSKEQDSKQYVNAIRCAEAAMDLAKTPILYCLTGEDATSWHREKLRKKKTELRFYPEEAIRLKDNLDTLFSQPIEFAPQDNPPPAINKLGGTAAYLQRVTETIFTDYLTKS